MINKIQIITLALTIITIYSCENHASNEQVEHATNKTETTEEHHHSKNNNLVLDNGKLWAANTETTAGVENMVNIMNAFSEKDSVRAYGTLTESLKTEFTMIFQNCTMTGEAHNQLHNFLIPIKDSFKPLSSTDLNECKDSFNKLNTHLKIYNEYFE